MSRAKRSLSDLDRGDLLRALGAATVPIALVHERRLSYANDAFRALFGGTRSADQALTAPEQRFLALADQVAATGEPGQLLQQDLHRTWPGERTARTRHFDVFCSRVRAQRHSWIGVLTIVVEVTERVGRHQELSDHADRQGVLAQATSAMHRSLEPSDELRALAWAAVPELADLAMVHLLTDPTPPGRLPSLPVVTDRVVVACSDARLDLPTPRGGLRWHGKDVLTQAIQAGHLVSGPVETGSTHVWAERAGTSALTKAGLHTLATAPVVVEDRVVAAVLFGCLAGRAPWDPRDLTVLGQIAEKAGHALGHGLSYQQTRQSALTLQRSLLTDPPDVPGLEIGVRYEPAGADEIGGDWYDAFTLDTGGIAIAIGDVVGHDMTAAAAMGQLRSTLRGALDRAEGPAAVLDRLDTIIQRLSITPFASMIYGQLHPTGHHWRLRWANAGHPPPLLLRPGQPPAWLDHTRGLILGTGKDHPIRTDAETDLHTGDILLIYTDGLVEHRNQDIDTGMHKLADLALTIGLDKPLNTLCDTLVRHTPGNDDVALLAVRAHRCSGSPT